MKSLVVVFGALLLIIAMPAFFGATHTARVQERTESFGGVTTAAGVYTGNVTLSQAVHDNNVIAVQSISSNVSADIPAAASYNSANRMLVFNGLAANTVRTAVIIYEIDNQELESYLLVWFTIANVFYVFTIIGMICGAIYAFFDS